MHILLAVVLGVISLTFASIAVLSLRVLISLIAKGPQAAQDAYERGCSLKGWLGIDH